MARKQKSSKHPILDKQLTKKLAAIYIKNWDNISQFFEPAVLTMVLKGFKLRDFGTIEHIPKENMSYIYTLEREGYIQLNNPNEPEYQVIREYSYHNGKDWERWERKLCHTFLVRDLYQLNEAKLIKAALFLQFPYLQKYKFNVYHMDSPCNLKEIDRGYGSEFYLQIKDKTPSLYVPYVALKEKDPEFIKLRHSTYHKRYYNRERCEKTLARHLEVLELPETLQLFDEIKKG